MRKAIIALVLTTTLLMSLGPAHADPEQWEPDDQDNTWTEEGPCLMVDYSKVPPVYYYTC